MCDRAAIRLRGGEVCFRTVMETTIFLVRHGETIDNARQVMQGQTQGELNERGREQARQVARRLAAEQIDAVISSDLRRSVQTAEEIAAPHGLPVITTPLLRERDWGGFTGRFIPDLRNEVWPDDVEPEEALLSRARSLLLYITTTFPGKRVVAVGHGIVNKAILSVHAGCKMREVQRMMNAEVRILTRILSLLLLLSCGLAMKAQTGRSLTDSLHYRMELQTTLSGGDHTPLWLNANRYGLSSLERANGYLRGAVARPLAVDSARRWGVGYGVDAALAAGFTSTLVVQQAYIEARWLKGVLTVGAKEYPMELKNPLLSSGSQTFGVNARPVPQVRLALPDYWTVPYTRKWLAVKGHVAYGMTTDDKWQKDFTHRQQRYTEHALYHSKAGYLRIGPRNITFEFGLEMACQFGGRIHYFDNVQQEEVIDAPHGLSAFYHAFVPGGSDTGDGDWHNAEGNHLGSWVARLNLDYASWNLGLYADHFFEDNSSMLHVSYAGWGDGDEAWTHRDNRYFVHEFKDWMLGAELTLKNTPWLSQVVLEYLYTKYQGGPVYHDHTRAISDHVCGRDQFYNHFYYTGWQHWGQVMGNPLYRSPLYNDNGQIRVFDNRFVAWHLGVGGQPAPHWRYRVLATWQRGYGTYEELLRDPQENVSLMVEAACQLPRQWQVKAALGLDTGKLYGDNFGVQLTLVKTGSLKIKLLNKNTGR